MSWYKHWFADELYMELYAHRDSAEARQVVDLFVHHCRVPTDGDPVLDLACGTGRHAFELARRGYRVLAADLSPTLLAAARRKTRKYDAHLQFLRADMRMLPFRQGRLAAVLQLFTAFGYFERDDENAAVIRRTAAALRPGGWYMLDYLNAGHVRRTLHTRSEQTMGSSTVVQERRLTDTRVEKRITLLGERQTRVFTESVRLFTLDDFRSMFGAAGLTLEIVLGDYDGSPLAEDSPRCIMLARASI